MSVNFTFSQKQQIAHVLDIKMNEPGSPIQNAGVMSLVHVKRSSFARGLDWLGSYSPISRTFAGAARVVGSIALLTLSTPTYVVLKATHHSEEAIQAKYMMGRATDELGRGLRECVSIVVESNLYDSGYRIIGSAYGEYAHYSKEQPQTIVYSNKIDEQGDLEMAGLSRQVSLNSIVEINENPEGTPLYPSPAGSPRRQADLFSRPPSPDHNQTPEGTPHIIGIEPTGTDMPHLELGS